MLPFSLNVNSFPSPRRSVLTDSTVGTPELVAENTRKKTKRIQRRKNPRLRIKQPNQTNPTQAKPNQQNQPNSTQFNPIQPNQKTPNQFNSIQIKSTKTFGLASESLHTISRFPSIPLSPCSLTHSPLTLSLQIIF